MKQQCDWCGDTATVTVRVDNIVGRVCDNCASEVQSEFTTATTVRNLN